MISPYTFAKIINSYLPEPHAALLNGIIFGINLKTNQDFYQKLQIVGLLHLVVLSGTNITLLASLIGSATRFFGKQISTLLTILIIIIFVVFVGPKAPIVRAAIMGILTLVAILYGRKNYCLYSLLLSLLIIGLFWRSWLTSVSLWLSFGATLGIIIFGAKKPTNGVISALRTSLAAQVFTTPIIFIYFRQVSLISPVANVLVSSLICPLMVFGFATVFLGSINYFLGLIPAYICYGILSYIIWIINTLSKIPFVFIKF